MARAPRATPTWDDLTNSFGLEPWLKTQPREVSLAIAARAALRVLPLFEGYGLEDKRRFAKLTLGLFWATALTWTAAKYPVHNIKLPVIGAARAASTASRAAATTKANHETADISSSSAISAALAASRAASAVAADSFVTDASYAFAAADEAAYGVDVIAASAAGASITASAGASDAMQLIETPGGLAGVLDAALWPKGTPDWASAAWARLRGRLSGDEDWDLWSDWYERRLRGGSLAEDYEIVFAQIPNEEWEEGARAANAWIRAHLPRTAPSPETDPPIPRPAAIRTFDLRDGRIVVAPQDARAEDLDSTRAFFAEARERLTDLREILARNRVEDESPLLKTLDRLAARLAVELDKIDIGLLVVSLVSLQGFVRVYSTDQGRLEHGLHAVSALSELAAVLSLLVGQFPRARAIVANQFELDIGKSKAAVEAVDRTAERLAEAAAAHPRLVDAPVAKELREPAQDIATAPTETDHANLSSLRLMSSLDFGAVLAKAPGWATAGAAGAALWATPEGHTLIAQCAEYFVHLLDALGPAGVGVGTAAAGIAKLIKALHGKAPTEKGGKSSGKESGGSPEERSTTGKSKEPSGSANGKSKAGKAAAPPAQTTEPPPKPPRRRRKPPGAGT